MTRKIERCSRASRNREEKKEEHESSERKNNSTWFPLGSRNSIFTATADMSAFASVKYFNQPLAGYKREGRAGEMKSPIQTLPTKRKRKQQLFLANLSSATGLFKGWLSGKGEKKEFAFLLLWRWWCCMKSSQLCITWKYRKKKKSLSSFSSRLRDVKLSNPGKKKPTLIVIPLQRVMRQLNTVMEYADTHTHKKKKS